MARGQPLAALGATALEDQTAGLSAHSLAESVGFRATTIIWLKGSLHITPP